MSQPLRRDRVEYDVAYGAFGFAGAAQLVVAGVSALPLDTGTAGGIGLLIVLPLYALAVAAMGAGLVLAVRLRDERRLCALGGLAVLVLLNFVADPLPAGLASIPPVVYGLFAVGWAIGWSRRR